MARFEFDKALNIRSMSGTLQRNRDGSKVVVRTSRTTGKMTVHLMQPSQRSTPVSDAEKAQRARFAAVARAIAARRRNGDLRPKHILWQEITAEYDAQFSRP